MASFKDRPLEAKTVNICPVCGKEATQEGKNGYILCLLHSWIKGIKSISIQGRA